jgi:hypothetical protein
MLWLSLLFLPSHLSFQFCFSSRWFITEFPLFEFDLKFCAS